MQPNDGEVELLDRKAKRKITKRKRVNPCMESQPLALADLADVYTPVQLPAAESPSADALPECATLSASAEDAFHTGTAPSSDPRQDHVAAQKSPTVAEGLLHLASSPGLQSNQAEALQANDVPSDEREHAAEAMPAQGTALAGSQDRSLAAVPPSDDEAEVSGAFSKVECLHGLVAPSNCTNQLLAVFIS